MPTSSLVVVDGGVARGLDLQVDQAVVADLVEHGVEEGHAGGHLALAAATESEPHPPIAFAGDAEDHGVQNRSPQLKNWYGLESRYTKFVPNSRLCPIA
jgi:hypothetical protein